MQENRGFWYWFRKVLLLVPKVFSNGFRFLFTSKGIAKGLFTLFFIIILTFNALLVSIDEKTPMPILKEIGGKFLGSNANINDEVDRFSEIENPSFFQTFWSFAVVFAELWFIYIWFVVMHWLLTRLFAPFFRFDKSTPPSQTLPIAIVFFSIVTIIYQIIIYSLQGILLEPFSLRWWWQLIPFSGLFNFIVHIKLYFQPFMDLLSKLKIV